MSYVRNFHYKFIVVALMMETENAFETLLTSTKLYDTKNPAIFVHLYLTSASYRLWNRNGRSVMNGE